jgi:hypothetical protein
MKKQVAFALFFLASVNAFAQDSSGDAVPYDPTFWAQELRLDADQRNKIETINAEFYEQLKNRPSLSQLQTFLEERQELILDTFHTRQKRKWEKIVSSL